jgi:hypothetical protein
MARTGKSILFAMAAVVCVPAVARPIAAHAAVHSAIQADTSLKQLGTFGGVRLVGKQTGYSLGSECVLIGWANERSSKVEVRFAIETTQRSGRVETRPGSVILDLGQRKGGGTFLGDDNSLSNCVFDSPIESWRVTNIQVTDVGERERREEAERKRDEAAQQAQWQDEARRRAADLQAEQERQRQADAQRVEAERQRDAEDRARRGVAESEEARDRAGRDLQGLSDVASKVADLEVEDGPLGMELIMSGSAYLYTADSSIGEGSGYGGALHLGGRYLLGVNQSRSLRLEAGGYYVFGRGTTAGMTGETIADAAGALNLGLSSLFTYGQVWFGPVALGGFYEQRGYAMDDGNGLTADETRVTQGVMASLGSLRDKQSYFVVSGLVAPVGQDQESDGMSMYGGRIEVGLNMFYGSFSYQKYGVPSEDRYLLSDDAMMVALGLRIPL